MEIVVKNHSQPNSVYMCLAKSICDQITSKSVVVSEMKGQLRIREASALDNKTLKIRGYNLITYTSANSKDYIGRWSVERDGDYYYLTEKI